MRAHALLPLGLVVPALLTAQTTIGAPGGSVLCCWGPGPVPQPAPVIGQTFVAPADARLDAFTYWVSRGGGFPFQAYVFAWDDPSGRATGPALFTSAPLSVPALGPGEVHQIDVLTGGVALVPGRKYVAFLGATTGGHGLLDVEYTPFDAYGSGEAVFDHDFDDFTGHRWFCCAAGFTAREDLHFAMTFGATASPVPEPGALALIASGLAGVAGVVRRRRREHA